MLALTFVCVYLAVVIIVGVVISRRSHNSVSEVLVAQGKMNLPALAGLLFGELVAGAGTVGTATNGFTGGFTGLYSMWGMAFGCFLVAIFLAPILTFLGKHKAMSGPEAFGLRFGQKTRYAALVIAFVLSLSLFAMQPKAIASVLAPTIGISIETCTLIIVAVFLVMALTGIQGIANMNFISSFVLFLGMLIAAVFCVQDVGGFEAIAVQLPESYFDPFAFGFIPAAGAILGQGLGYCISATPMNACFSSKSLKNSRIAFVGGGVFVIIFAMLPLLIGMTGAIKMPDADPNSILYLMPESISPVLSAFAVLAVAAACFSSGPFFLLYLSTLFIRDIAGPLMKEADDKKQIRYLRIFLVVAAVCSVFLANNTSNIITQIIGVSSVQAVMTVVLIIGMYWKRTTNVAAFWSIVIGCGAGLVWHILGQPYGVATLYVGLAFGIVVLVIGSFATSKGKVSDDFKRFNDWKQSEDKRQLTEGEKFQPMSAAEYYEHRSRQ